MREVVEGVLAQAGLLNICREQEVMQHWDEIVGAQIAKVTECDRVENGVLYVRVTSAAWRHEISYFTHDILSSIAQKTSCTTIRHIVFNR